VVPPAFTSARQNLPPVWKIGQKSLLRANGRTRLPYALANPTGATPLAAMQAARGRSGWFGRPAALHQPAALWKEKAQHYSVLIMPYIVAGIISQGERLSTLTRHFCLDPV